jgi:hypothetical protein
MVIIAKKQSFLTLCVDNIFLKMLLENEAYGIVILWSAKSNKVLPKEF